MNLKEFKKMYFEEAKRYFLEKRRLFSVDMSNERYLKIFSSYFSGDVSFENSFGGNLDKGLYVYGGVGVGKTSSFRILQGVHTKTKNLNHWIKIVSCQQVVTDFNQKEDKDAVIKYYSRGKILFDDLGAEPIASNYGKEEIFIRILELRYDEFLEKGTKTFITSNLSIEGIKGRYGVRIFDRFFEMMNLITFNGEESKRY